MVGVWVGLGVSVIVGVLVGVPVGVAGWNRQWQGGIVIIDIAGLLEQQKPHPAEHQTNEEGLFHCKPSIGICEGTELYHPRFKVVKMSLLNLR